MVVEFVTHGVYYIRIGSKETSTLNGHLVEQNI